MSDYLIEVCCGSAEDAIMAAAGGADRVELCSNLFQGGLTPSLGSIDTIRQYSDIEIMAMIRPREGGFCYNNYEYQTALNDAKRIIAADVDGLVCGFLHEDGSIDLERSAAILEIAAGRPVTFHRAFDVVPDWRQAIDQLAELGFSRVLTSGQKPNVLLAEKTIKEMIAYAGDRLCIMPGAGITVSCANAFAEATGAKELHLRPTRPAFDLSTKARRDIYFGSALYPSETTYPVIDAEAVAKLKG